MHMGLLVAQSPRFSNLYCKNIPYSLCFCNLVKVSTLVLTMALILTTATVDSIEVTNMYSSASAVAVAL
jgi:hypothetical protein